LKGNSTACFLKYLIRRSYAWQRVRAWAQKIEEVGNKQRGEV
jgi:hypothetical protein